MVSDEQLLHNMVNVTTKTQIFEECSKAGLPRDSSIQKTYEIILTYGKQFGVSEYFRIILI